ncbi:MAG: phosphoenolpyruvate--protein phosphotransferase [Sandaracinus sp.]|nr:phosphoenolpyruvate--protein phosphotransferase [Sandaracinus sp.]MCB9632330.1 phosphoenolpyruvate--protein phosphotransferase [Sandaracinus sp.]
MTRRPSEHPLVLGLPERLEVPGIAASLGVVVGSVHVVPRAGRAPRRRATDRAREVERLRSALEATRADLQAARDGLDEEMGLVLDALLLMHSDRLFVDATVERIERDGLVAEWALERTLASLKAPLLASPNRYFRERADDLEHVGAHVLRHLRGEQDRWVLPERELVLVAADLSPADAARILGDARVLGLVTEAGSATSHTALLARALEVPAVVGVRGLLDRLEGAPDAIVDALRGRVVVAPEAGERADAVERGARFLRFTHTLRDRTGEPARTRDGHDVEVLANIELPAEAGAARAHGAPGIGLYRTEFLYLGRGNAPDEEEQLEVYRSVVEAAEGGPVVLRTFDLGGDKLPSGLRIPTGPNPALGLRALRLSLRRPGLFRAQVRAVLRAAASGDVRLLLPLVTTVGELRAARRRIEEYAQELAHEGVEHRIPRIGAMVEVPAAALRAEALAAEADFLSVGTNDLVQYTLAADRGDPGVAELADPLEPAVLELLRRVVAAGSSQDVPVSMCGDMAADPVALPLVLGLGFRRLSVPLAALPFVHETVRRVDVGALGTLVEAALAQDGAAEVRALIRDALASDLGGLWAEQGVT